MNSKLTACLIDDDPNIRNAFKAVMKSSGISHVTYANAEDFLENLDDRSTGALVVDVRMPGMGGLELLDELRRNKNVFTPVIILTAHADIPLAVKAMRLGAMDVIEKPYREEDLLERVRAAFARHERLNKFQSERQAIAPKLATLTSREVEVLDLMVEGKKNRKIAEVLGISTKTLDIHRANIMRKMGTKTVADLVRWRLMEKADPFTLNPLSLV
jgi:two-component system, LuxR family, response regulator FixJ